MAKLPFQSRGPREPTREPSRGWVIDGRARRKPPAPKARPGAARSLPMTMLSKLPVIGRLAPPPPEPTVPLRPSLRQRLSPSRLVRVLRAPPEPAPERLSIPFVSPAIRRVRAPLASTARMVEAARDARRPLTRWERLREAARQALDEPRDSLRWERLMGLSVALASNPPPPRARPRGPLQRLLRGPEPAPAERPSGLRQKLLASVRPGQKKAGPDGRRNRRGSAPKNS